MGLYDAESINAVRAALDSLPGGRDILLYGEPWQGGASQLHRYEANKANLAMLNERVGIFCDDTRDAIKGGCFDAREPGYVEGKPGSFWDIGAAVAAWCRSDRLPPHAPSQIVSYVSAHDNFTLWDKLLCVRYEKPEFTARDSVALAQNRLAAGIYLTSFGLPFMQAGEEWGRTKHGDHNSYKGPLETNKLDWTRAHRPEFAALTAFYRGMLAIRRTCARIAGAYGEPQPFVLALQGWLIGFIPESPDPKDVVVVYYNPERTHQWVSLPIGSWRKLADGVHAGTNPFGPIYRDAMELPPVSVTVLRLEQ